MDLRRFVDILARRAGVVLVTFAAAVVAAYAVWSALPVSYTASAMLRVPTSPFGSDWRQYDLGYADRLLNTLAASTESDRVRSEVAGRLRESEMPHIDVEVLANTELLRVESRPSTPHAAARAADTVAEVLADLAQTMTLGAGAIGPRPEVVAAARPPEEQRGPSLPLTLALAAIVGAAAGLLLAFVAENFDDRLYDADDIADALHHPVLTRVPRLRGLAAPGTEAGRAYRRLRSHVLAFGGAERPRTILVAPTAPGAGASTTVANLARVLADGGWWVIVVDGDPAAQHQSDLLGAKQKPSARGRKTSAAGPATPVPTSVAGVTLVTTKPADVPDILDDLRHRAYVVLVDVGVSGITADAAFLGSAVDGVLLTVRAGRTRPQDLEDARVRLASVGARVLGAVVTHTRGSRERSSPGELEGLHSRLEEPPAAPRTVSGSAGRKQGRS
jgi:capsular polysaccharide biosynthesis protein/Mrp family chromosome partitioning ATPase